jgi:hypothetical protein
MCKKILPTRLFAGALAVALVLLATPRVQAQHRGHAVGTVVSVDAIAQTIQIEDVASGDLLEFDVAPISEITQVRVGPITLGDIRQGAFVIVTYDHDTSLADRILVTGR